MTSSPAFHEARGWAHHGHYSQRWLAVSGWSYTVAAVCLASAVFLEPPYHPPLNGVARALFACGAVAAGALGWKPESLRRRVITVVFVSFAAFGRAFALATYRDVKVTTNQRVVGVTVWAGLAVLTYALTVTLRITAKRRGHD